MSALAGVGTLQSDGCEHYHSTTAHPLISHTQIYIYSFNRPEWKTTIKYNNSPETVTHYKVRQLSCVAGCPLPILVISIAAENKSQKNFWRITKIHWKTARVEEVSYPGGPLGEPFGADWKLLYDALLLAPGAPLFPYPPVCRPICWKANNTDLKLNSFKFLHYCSYI